MNKVQFSVGIPPKSGNFLFSVVYGKWNSGKFNIFHFKFQKFKKCKKSGEITKKLGIFLSK